MKPVLATVICALGVSSLVAANAATQCREAKDVLASVTDLATNEKAGGHVKLHLFDQPTVAGKSMFKDWAEFLQTFQAWQKSKTEGGNCPANAKEGSNVVDCVDPKSVNISQGIYCVHTGTGGLCDANGGTDAVSKTFDAVKVAFRYRNSAEEHGKWALISAYPTAQKTCPDN
jgi:hypothetical protein